MDTVIADAVARRLSDLTRSREPHEVRLLLRLCEKLETNAAGCWVWRGYTRNGYGRTSSQGRTISIHRAVFEVYVRPLEDAETLDHRCLNRACANPEHLEPVTLSENVSRSWASESESPRPNHNREKTHCPNGHPYDATRPSGSRRCRVCERERKAERRIAPEFADREREIRRDSYHRNKGERLPPPSERTHCPKGHPYDAENTAYTPKGGRVCLTCRREYNAAYRAAHKPKRA